MGRPHSPVCPIADSRPPHALGGALTPPCPPPHRQPDKVVVVWTRRNRRVCSKVGAGGGAMG